jgi:hypothetical protein
MDYTITITYRDGSEATVTASSARHALAICNEEIKWENTLKVVCPAIQFEEVGSFV